MIMVLFDNKTLVIRHLPNELNKDDKVDLLKFFGAEEVKCVTAKNDRQNTVFAKYGCLFSHLNLFNKTIFVLKN